MTTSFSPADTKYAPTIHDAVTSRRSYPDGGPDPETSRVVSGTPRSSAFGWLVSVTAALIGIATFSITAAYAIDEFATSPVPSSNAAIAPEPAPAPPAPPTTWHHPVGPHVSICHFLECPAHYAPRD